MLNSLRVRLYLWYVGSLAVLAAVFYILVHDMAWVHGNHSFEVVFGVLAIAGFIIIYKFTQSLNKLSAKMRQITYKNLNERITDVKGEDEIGELALTFNKLLDRLHEAFGREQQFIGDVAHELKTPIANLRSSLEIGLQKRRNNDEYKEIIQQAISETDRISSTLRNILDLAWSETPNDQKKAEKFNLSQLLEELCEISQKMTTQKEIKTFFDIEKNVHLIGYKDKLARALLNIIENAVKYTPTNGKIEVEMETIHNKAIISVKDTGVGIADDEQQKIFERFYRGVKTDKIFGSGLGLAISRSMINLHNGEIKVNSQPNKGTTFIISLPLQNN